MGIWALVIIVMLILLGLLYLIVFVDHNSDVATAILPTLALFRSN